MVRQSGARHGEAQEKQRALTAFTVTEVKWGKETFNSLPHYSSQPQLKRNTETIPTQSVAGEYSDIPVEWREML